MENEPITNSQNEITIIITTSPIPSNPSTQMFSQTLTSLALTPYFTNSRVIIVCDGFTIRSQSQLNSQYKSSKISTDEAQNYIEFQKEVVKLLTTTTTATETTTYEERFSPTAVSKINRIVLNSKYQMLTHSIRLGFALAIRSALTHVSTPYILIMQHDWAFKQEIPIENLIRILNEDQDQDKEINYIGFPSRRSLDYVNCKSQRAPNIPPEVIIKNEQPFTRLVFWYDRPHIGRTSFYMTQVFGHRRFKRGDFIEDTFGHEVMNDCKTKGLDGWKMYGSWLWYPYNGKVVILRHLNGRKYGLNSYYN